MIGAIVLAAGGSTRMGRPKQLIEIDGETLIRRASIAALDGGCDPVVVVLGANATSCAGELMDLDVTAAINSDWELGMGTSLRVGLQSLLEVDSSIDAVTLLVCDQPHIDEVVVRRLTDLWERNRKPIAACRYADTVGSPACFARSWFPAISAIADGEGARHLIRQARPAELVTIDWPQGAIDLDTPDDLDRLEGST